MSAMSNPDSHPTQYSTPPITEAVIGVNFSNAVKESDIASALKKFALNYPHNQIVSSFDVAFELQKHTKPTADVNQKIGHRLSTAHMDQLVVIWPTSVTVSQLAPYQGWDIFFGRFIRDWRMLKRVIGFQPISRLGLRYINRVDIPFKESIVEHEKFLNLYPRVPEAFSALDAYAIQTLSHLESIDCNLKINSARVPSPVLNHASFILDLDISMEANPPQNDEDIFSLLEKMRLEKNRIFEACISNHSRELFQ